MDSSCNGVEEKMLFSLYSQMPQAEKKGGRRRRKKARAESDAEGKKRRLSDEQVRFLEHSFVEERKLESGRKVHLATELGLEPKQVAVWFQNRRARWKNKQLEEEYLRLKSHHDAAVVDKCHLENEVLKLKERLLEAEEEIRRLAAASGGAGGGSPSSSSFSTDVRQPELGEFRVDGDDLMYMNEYNSLSNYMEWGYLYGM